ncbi:MAG: hypothetical protein KGI24_09570 [Candidatus Omnitrophica bacterium]|nr:hypothetical protein [Candidatus Omnitrophota bacterium]
MFLRRLLCSWITVSFLAAMIVPPPQACARTVLNLPAPGTMVSLSTAYTPVLLRGLKVNPANPLALDFIVATGNSRLDPQDPRLKKISEKLIKYFFAALTLPEKDVWVNLSPYEKDRIIPRVTGETTMGRDMLAQDYILKQITASLIYPGKKLGREFWNRVYAEAYRRFGTTQIPVNTFNKVWIVADKASVYAAGHTVFVVGSHLKVMLDEDYQALYHHQQIRPDDQAHALASRIIRQIVLPALEKEVNEGRNFANLRQIFNSLILAKWYKETLKNALLNQVYSDKNKIAGVQVSDKNIKEEIYQQYLRAYKKGVFDYVKEDIDQTSKQPMPRKYFSGGITAALNLSRASAAQERAAIEQEPGQFIEVDSREIPSEGDAAMASRPSRQEVRQLRQKAREFTLDVVSQTAAQTTAMDLRGAYQHVLDIIKRNAQDKQELLLDLQELFTSIYAHDGGESIEGIKEIKRIVSWLMQQKVRSFNEQDIQKVKDEAKKAIKDTADALAKRIYERTAKKDGVIMMVRVSEGFGRDEVAESLKSNEVIMPDELRGEITGIYAAVSNDQEFFYSRFTHKWYPIVDSILDVIEGTNQFITNTSNKPLEELTDNEAGATSFIVTGLGARALNNLPDGYVGQFFTNLGDPENVAEFNRQRVRIDGHSYRLDDPDLYARHPEKIRDYLEFLARMRGQPLQELQEQIVLMNRTRETRFLEVLRNLQEGIPGLDINIIEDGTFPQGVKTILDEATYYHATGKVYGKHKTMITIGGSAEGFAVLALAGAAKTIGAVGGIRVYSAKLNKDSTGQEVRDYSRRYAFTPEEQKEISELRPQDAQQILEGKKLFTTDDVRGDVLGGLSFITNNGVFDQSGTGIAHDAAVTGALLISNIGGRFDVELKQDRVANPMEHFRADSAMSAADEQNTAGQQTATEADRWARSLTADQWDRLQGKFVVVGEYKCPAAHVLAVLKFFERQITSPLNIISPAVFSLSRSFALQAWNPDMVSDHAYFVYIFAQVARALARSTDLEFKPADINTISGKNLPRFYLPKKSAQTDKAFEVAAGQMRRLLGNWQERLVSDPDTFSILPAVHVQAVEPVQPQVQPPAAPPVETPAAPPVEAPAVSAPGTPAPAEEITPQLDRSVTMLTPGKAEDVINYRLKTKNKLELVQGADGAEYLRVSAADGSESSRMPLNTMAGDLVKDPDNLQVAVAGGLVFIKDASVMKIYELNANDRLAAVDANAIEDVMDALKTGYGHFSVNEAKDALGHVKKMQIVGNGESSLHLIPLGHEDSGVIFPVWEIHKRVFGFDHAYADWAAGAGAEAFPGGIDLNASKLQLDKTGPGVEIQFDPAMIARFKRGNFSGIVPVITAISPIADIYPLLGLKAPQGNKQLADL